MATIIRSFGFVLSACRSLLVRSSSPTNEEMEISGLLDDLEWVERTLAYAKAALVDAEKRAVRGEKLVQEWLSDIQDLAYRASDLIGVYEYEFVAQEVRNRDRDRHMASSSSMAMAGKRKFDLVNNYSSSPLMDPSFRKEFISSVSKLRKYLDEVNTHKDMFCFDMEDAQTNISTDDVVFEHPLTGSIPDGDLFIGRDENMQDLIRLLLLTDNKELENDYCSTVPVIALVGMGGVGKTTLAQHVFHDPDVSKHYSMKGWVCVSDDFNPKRLTRATLEALDLYVRSYSEELSTLQRHLAKAVREKKFLLILDDVWNDNLQLWNTFYSSLRHGGQGSKIIVTTRSQKVAHIMQPLTSIDVGCLSEEDSWALFQKFAFIDHRKTQLEHPRLVSIGKKIAAKCNGLPLAIKVLGSCLIREREDEDRWKYVLETTLWDISMWEEGKQVLGPLILSYLHLPAHLKPCFVMSSVFPKDANIQKQKLLELWMAHGLVEDHNEYEEGLRYIEELQSRSFFFQPRDKIYVTLDHIDHHPFVMMHDFIHDLAQYLWRDRIFRVVDNPTGAEGKMELMIPHGIHHAFVDISTRLDLSLQLCHDRNYTFSLRTLESCRYKWPLKCPERVTFDSLRKLSYYESVEDMNDSLLHGYLGKLRNLRQLDIWPQSGNRSKIRLQSICTLYSLRILNLNMPEDTCIHLPESIGNLRQLIHIRIRHAENVPGSICCLTKLRTLGLQGARISYLPDQLSELVNLKNLMLERSYIQELPESICNLKSLGYLSLRSCSKLRDLPVSLADLTSLKTLLIGGKPRYYPSGFGNLRKLQNLPEFLVPPSTSAANHAGIEELSDLVNIQDSITILGLNNVVQPEHAALAKLENKVYIWDLGLCWAEIEPDFRDGDYSEASKVVEFDELTSTKDELVLENLRPHTSIKILRISRWRGRRLAAWVGDESFVNIEYILIENLPYCASMSPLHQLLSLKHLRCSMLPSMTCLALITSSSSLHSNPDTSTVALEPSRRICFPMLDYLNIGRGCPKLASLVSAPLSSLTNLKLSHCHSLTDMPLLPQIEALSVAETSAQLENLLQSLLALKKLTLSRCTSSGCIPLHQLAALETLIIYSCSNVWFPDSIANFSPSLGKIEIELSPRLKEWCLTHRQQELAHLKLHETANGVSCSATGYKPTTQF